MNKNKSTKTYVMIFILSGVLIFSLAMLAERFMRGETATPNNLADFYYGSLLGWFFLLLTDLLVFVVVITIFFFYISPYISSLSKWADGTVFVFVLIAMIYFLVKGSFSVYGYADKIEKLYANNQLLYVFDRVAHSSKYGTSYVYRKHTFNAKTLERINREMVEENTSLNYPSHETLSSDALPSYIFENKDHYDAINEPIAISADGIIIIATKGCLFQLDKKTKNVLKKIRL